MLQLGEKEDGDTCKSPVHSRGSCQVAGMQGSLAEHLLLSFLPISHAVREMMAGSGVVGVVVKESPVSMFHYRCRLFFFGFFTLIY